MARKFITFIGTTVYKDTEYYFGDDKTNISKPVCYVQAALFEKVLSDWDTNDSVYVFTTVDAYEYNYKNRLTNFQTKDRIPNRGLEEELRLLKEAGKIGSYQHIEIPDGINEVEIWTIFQKIFEQIKPQDDLYFDITNGFRSLPMLGMVLIDYAKVLLNSAPKAIYYGNYEAGNAQKKPEDKYVKAPIIDITSFSNLQAWTTATQSFLNGGNAVQLSELIAPINTALAKNLLDFTESILTCRGKMLTQDLDIDSFKNLVSLSRTTTYEKQLTPILKRIEDKVTTFSSQNVKNGFKAVEWCIENGLIQQGYTFLLETVISYIIERTYGIKKVNEKDYRDCASAALHGYDTKQHGSTPDTKIIRLKEFISSKSDLSRIFKKLTGKSGLRNDINHCGYSPSPKSPKELKKELENLYKHIYSILKIQ